MMPNLRFGIVLPEQCDPIDRQRIELQLRKPPAQHLEDRSSPLRVQPSGQRHVEAEFFHDVRVAPAVEIVALALAEFLRLPAGTILGAQRGAKFVKIADAIGGELLELA